MNHTHSKRPLETDLLVTRENTKESTRRNTTTGAQSDWKSWGVQESNPANKTSMVVAVLSEGFGFQPGGPVSSPSSVRPETKVQRKIEQLELEVVQLKEQLAQLQDKLRDQGAPRVSKATGAGIKPYTNQYKRWIREHMDELAKYPDCFVAIDPSKGDQGLILHASDEEEFSDRLLEIYASDPGSRQRLLLTHTSVYMDAPPGIRR